MTYLHFGANKVCNDFVKEFDFRLFPRKKSTIGASKRFFWGVQQQINYEMDQDIRRLPFFKRLSKRLQTHFQTEDLLDEYEDHIRKRGAIVDYDEFRYKVKDLLESTNTENRKEGGILAEKYLTKFVLYKSILNDLNENEYYPFYYDVKDNLNLLPSSFHHNGLKFVLAEDFTDGREIHEFKATASIKEDQIQNRLKSAYCQACFYCFLDYHSSNVFSKIRRYIFPYKIIVEIYQVKRNKIVSYEFGLNYKNFQPDFWIIRKISKYYQDKTGINIYRLIRRGAFREE